jgi:hypothetical protein
MSVVNNNLLLAGIDVAPVQYELSRSLRFNTPDSAYANRTFGTPTTQETFTLAMWVKRAALSTAQSLFGVSTNHSFAFTTGNALNLTFGGTSALTTTAVFRDMSAWYHIVWTQSGTSHTVYVNGTSRGTATATSSVFNTAVAHQVGASNTTNYFNGYLADVHFIDGQALTPSSFTETKATTGQLVPKAYGGTYGTNGFRLNFSDNSAATAATLGADSSGNGNNWTPNNLSVLDGRTAVLAATGGLPIYNTTDTYGTVKGSGTRTDSNAASLVLAIPMDGANNGTTFTDESATIRGSGSAISLIRNGDTKTVTNQSKFYGSSGFFDGTGDALTSTASAAINPFTAGDFTIEHWAYFNSIASGPYTFSTSRAAGGGPDRMALQVGSTGEFLFFIATSSSQILSSSAGVCTIGNWVHLAASRQGSTVRLFVNGVQVASNSGLTLFTTVDQRLEIGSAFFNNSNYLNGYIQDLRVYKGVAKYTSNFTPPSATQNTTIAAGCDSLTDTPTSYGTDTGAGGEVKGNYATLNPLGISSFVTYSNGNLDITGSFQQGQCLGTIAVSSGKWYYETTLSTFTAGDSYYGISTYDAAGFNYPGQVSTSYSVYTASAGSLFRKVNNGAQTNTDTARAVQGDIIGIAFDLDSGKFWASKNGTWIDSGNPSAGTNPLFSSISGAYIAAIKCSGLNTGTVVNSANFGQRPFAYAAPSGFKALCDTNLPAPTIAKGSTVFDTTLYTGTGAALTPTSSLAFSPDLVWIKGRSGATDHALYDTVRGVTLDLVSNSTAAETTQTQGLTSFDSNGFSVGTLAKLNTNAATYAGWCWDAGSSTVTNTDGSISSQVRANVSAGFSVVTYTGTGANATVGHGLGIAPSMVIVKRRDTTGNWQVRHTSIAVANSIQLNATTAAAAATTVWNSTAPSSTVFSIGTSTDVNASAGTYVAYCFTSVTGYSSFSTYPFNASGQFVCLGFRPAFLMIKRTNGTSNWVILDGKRAEYNVDNDAQYPNLAAVDGTTDLLDITSNGFKLRSNNVDVNGVAGMYIYAAFAENPFQYTRAR